MNQDICTISVVNFHAGWGKIEENLNRIRGYLLSAAKKGSEFVLFPEMALTGYDPEPGKSAQESMQGRLAQTAQSAAVKSLAELCRQLRIYAGVGMPERAEDGSGRIYNSCAFFTPEGFAGFYRKMHNPQKEPLWASPGDRPFLLETPWGPVGCGICYDTYCFPELLRYYAAKGCRLYLNPTALSDGIHLGGPTIEAAVAQNEIYIATANLVGRDRDNVYCGGSSILGPDLENFRFVYYAGHPFSSTEGKTEELITATIDLSLAHRFIYQKNELTGKPGWTPERYIRLYEELVNREGPEA